MVSSKSHPASSIRFTEGDSFHEMNIRFTTLCHPPGEMNRWGRAGLDRPRCATRQDRRESRWSPPVREHPEAGSAVRPRRRTAGTARPAAAGAALAHLFELLLLLVGENLVQLRVHLLLKALDLFLLF